MTHREKNLLALKMNKGIRSNRFNSALWLERRAAIARRINKAIPIVTLRGIAQAGSNIIKLRPKWWQRILLWINARLRIHKTTTDR
jgi:hypothetical protein